MKTILVTGAGGTPSTNFVRSLRAAPENFHLVGTDSNKFNIFRAETDERFLVPYARDPLFIEVLTDIIQRSKSEFIHAQPDEEIYMISKYRDRLGIRTFLPRHETIETCQDKFESYQAWRKAGLHVPRTMRVANERDLRKAFDEFGPPVWVRAVVSPGGGKGSLKADRYELAKSWIDFCEGWGAFEASEYLSPRTVTWMSIWKEGELVVAQGRERLYWELGNRAPSGVTGITGAGVTVSDPLVDKVALGSIYAIDKEPNGIFSVDMTYDRDGVPNPTEINIGRFFTTHYFFTRAGLNMAYIYTKLAYGERPPRVKRRMNPLPAGLCWIRGMDFLPILTTLKKVQQYENQLNTRIRRMKSH